MKIAETVEAARNHSVREPQPTNPNNERGAAIIKRYRAMNRPFRDLEVALADNRTYHRINLGTTIHPELGEGAVVATLSHANRKSVIVGSGDADIGYTVGVSFEAGGAQHKLEGLEEDYADRGTNAPWNKLRLSDPTDDQDHTGTYIKEWTPAQVHLAEETLDILEPKARETYEALLTAVLDPSLNPELAAQVAATGLRPSVVGQ